ncbi:MAG: hypothetical protein GJU74_12695, partial [Metallibacterium scheffleri]|nr:hypothetical protein [Metallibacterium scheffleri]
MKAKFVPMHRAAAVLRGAAVTLAGALALGLPCAHALQSDRSQPLLIDAGA